MMHSTNTTTETHRDPAGPSGGSSDSTGGESKW